MSMISSVPGGLDIKFPSKVPVVQQLKNDKNWERTGYRIDFPVLNTTKVERALGKRGISFSEHLIKQKWFYNEKDKILKGAVYFSRECEGPLGKVHGGGIATALDNALGWLCVRLAGFGCVTLYLNVTYKKFIPLNSVVQIEAYVDRIENDRKFYVKCKLKNAIPVDKLQQPDLQQPNEEIIHAEADALFYKALPFPPTFHELKRQYGPQVQNVEEVRTKLITQLKNKKKEGKINSKM